VQVSETAGEFASTHLRHNHVGHQQINRPPVLFREFKCFFTAAGFRTL
jgi:hypothetical protein